MVLLKLLIEEGQITDPDSPRGRLLDQAAQLFLQKGYERTTVRDLASAVGIQSGSIFHHFSSKEDILKAVMSEALVYFIEELRAAIEAAQNPRHRLLACIRSELQFTIGADTTAVMSLLISEWRSLSVEAQGDILHYRSRYEQQWLDVLNGAKEVGLVDGDVFVMRRLLAGAIHWTTTWFQLDGELSLEALANETLHLVCSGDSQI
ncbi:MAG: TetR/AcrR family transcriptional regulator [Halioglobus sp.]|nr:TetR/AcrR family transcriptional regulator [Halioglobus sp.]